MNTIPELNARRDQLLAQRERVPPHSDELFDIDEELDDIALAFQEIKDGGF